jgi:L-alanine-DL-glutamate epimerase-like enolase superfamily enzyme
MKITRIEIFDLETSIGPDWHPVLVRLDTDEGIRGVGEVGLAYGSAHSAGAGMVRNLAEECVLDADPMKTEALWDTMHATFWALGGGPVVFGGMSAIDTALWDIKGKALNVPVYQLLGGKTNDALRTYASQIQFGWGSTSRWCAHPDDYAEEAVKAVADGYDCVKVDPVILDADGEYNPTLRGVLPHQQVTLFRNRVKAIREAVGSDVDIILEVHAMLSATTAIQLGRIWEEFNCMYLEEPVHYLNVDLQHKVTQNVQIPIAAGERLYTRWGYRQYLEKQLINMIQPDLGLVGGITEGKKICDYAHTYDIAVQVHVCGSPIATAAALHLEAAIPNFEIHEHHTYALKAGNIRLCRPNYQPVHGIFTIPDVPGLGIELNDDVIGPPTMVVK